LYHFFVILPKKEKNEKEEKEEEKRTRLSSLTHRISNPSLKLGWRKSLSTLPHYSSFDLLSSSREEDENGPSLTRNKSQKLIQPNKYNKLTASSTPASLTSLSSPPYAMTLSFGEVLGGKEKENFNSAHWGDGKKEDKKIKGDSVEITKRNSKPSLLSRSFSRRVSMLNLHSSSDKKIT